MRAELKTIFIITSVSFLLYTTFCVIMYATQRRQIYFPTPESQNNATESFFLPVSGAKLKIWSLHKERKPAIIYFGGNAEDVAGNLTDFARMFPAYAIYLVNYRSDGGSTGKPSEIGLCNDAVAIFDSLINNHQRISVIGRSLGSAIAVYLASLRPVEKLALVTPFASLTAVAQAHLPFLPVSLLLKDRYEAAPHVPKIKAQVLMVIAENDEIIPLKQSKTLLEKFAGKPCKIVIIPETGHNTLDQYDKYREALKSFFNSKHLDFIDR